MNDPDQVVLLLLAVFALLFLIPLVLAALEPRASHPLAAKLRKLATNLRRRHR
jgi:hypothetical protein